MSVISPPLSPRDLPEIVDGGERADGKALRIFWEPQGELDRPAWVEAGRKLGAFGRGGQWWVGDWLVYGTFRWGKKYTEAARITGYDVGSLRNMAWMASQFPPERRRVALTWCHHAAVASLSVDEQEKWLDLVSAQRLTVADLRLALRAERAHCEEVESSAATSEAPRDAVAQVICPHCGGEVPLPESARPSAGASEP
jgi:hypothetical protein